MDNSQAADGVVLVSVVDDEAVDPPIDDTKGASEMCDRDDLGEKLFQLS